MANKPGQEHASRGEDEYFAKQDAELIKQMRAKLDKEREDAEKQKHFMKCPKCGSDMKEEDRGHVKVDVCPGCGGMFLDAGELELMAKVESSGGKNIIASMFSFGSGKGAKGVTRK